MGANDGVILQIKQSDGTWVNLSPVGASTYASTEYSNGAFYTINDSEGYELISYVGQIIELRFYFYSDSNSYSRGKGPYIDDIQIN